MRIVSRLRWDRGCLKMNPIARRITSTCVGGPKTGHISKPSFCLQYLLRAEKQSHHRTNMLRMLAVIAGAALGLYLLSEEKDVPYISMLIASRLCLADRQEALEPVLE